MIKFIVIVSLFFTNHLFATDFYVSSVSGSNTNNGLSPATAWQTIPKVNNSMSLFNAGDRILFKRGETFEGTIAMTKSGSNTNPIVFDAYGVGEPPIITGARSNSNWVLHAPNIWKTTIGSLSQKITQVFKNNEQVFQARFPNEDYHFSSSIVNDSTFVAAMPAQPDGFLDNAFIVARTKNWYYNTEKVLTQVGNTITCSKFEYPFISKSGFYFYGKYEFLDKQDEWFYDATTTTLYYYSTSDPSVLNLKSSLFGNGFKSINQNNITVKNLKFYGQSSEGVRFEGGGNNITIENCIFENIELTGITFSTSSNAVLGTNNKIVDNSFRNINHKGITISRQNNFLVSGNTIKKIGVKFPGYAARGSDGIGASRCSGGVYRYNVIDSIGKSGMIITDSNSLIEKNIISNYGLTLDDLAGVYIVAYEGSGAVGNNIVKNNFTFKGHTYLGAWNNNLSDPSLGNAAAGLYTDHLVSDTQWIKNTSYENSGYGIISLNAINNTYDGNVCYGNRWAHLFFENTSIVAAGFNNAPGLSTGNKIFNSTYYLNVPQISTGAGSQQSGIFKLLKPNYTIMNYITEVNNNNYINAYNPNQISKTSLNGIGGSQNFVQWKSFYTTDLTSKICVFTNNATNPDQSVLFLNMNDNPKTEYLQGTWYNLDGTIASNTQIIEPWYSKILVKGEGAIVLSVDQVNNDATSFVKIYPNAIGKGEILTIECINSIKSVEIYDNLGKVIYTNDFNNLNNKEEIILNSSFSNGLFYLKIATDNKIITTKLIVK